jgi:hypothetical protein
MRIMAMAVMVAGIVAQARETDQKVTVCMQTGVDPAVLQAQAMASKILAGIRVTLEWRRDQRSCPEGPGVILITLANGTRQDSHPGALALASPYQGAHVEVFYDRVRKTVGPRTAPFLLAHVLAHEIGHLLQGISRHAEAGVMKAQWDNKDYQRMAWKPLSFTEHDVKLIHLGLEKRASLPCFTASR